MTDWVPVVDISKHQGPTDFATMRSKGVRGLILRISHGLTLDERFEEYWHGALAGGFAAHEIGAYPFLNPKRGGGAETGAFAVEAIKHITGRPDFLYMLDIENYRNESPNVGLAPVYGAAFAAYIREHIGEVRRRSPKSRVIGYTNRAYWNGKVAGTTEQWVGDDQLAGELDWIVARYPAYSEAAYARRPLPTDTKGWGDWAFNTAPDGPFPPRGATWKAWQFSAGYNRQGAPYGVSSSDLDLNIVHPDAWAKWTATPPTPKPPPQGDPDMPQVITNADPAQYQGVPYDPGVIKWVIDRPNVGSDVASKRHLAGAEHASYGSPAGTPLNNAQLGDLPDFVPTAAGGGTVDQVARDGVARIGGAISDIRLGGQRIADAGGQ